LVGGFHTEYTSLKFAMFFLAEYINMITVSALAVTLFLCGWRPPPPLGRIDVLSEGWFPMVWFLLKVIMFIFVFVWLRGTLPRMRYDQFMKLGWKILVPASLIWILLVATMRTATLHWNSRSLVVLVAIVFLVVLSVLYLLPQPAPEASPQEGSGLDLLSFEEGGFPTPPLDLVVPATPRSLASASLIAPTAPTTQPEADRG
ncbi:MAG: NADH-quinone oxidoreductase subunit H, partial [Mycobacteriales bacterium]